MEFLLLLRRHAEHSIHHDSLYDRTQATGSQLKFQSFIYNIFVNVFIKRQFNGIHLKQFDILLDDRILRLCQNAAKRAPVKRVQISQNRQTADDLRNQPERLQVGWRNVFQEVIPVHLSSILAGRISHNTSVQTLCNFLLDTVKNLQQIVPDFIVDTYDDGTINLSLNNRNVPELRMSRDFTEMVEEHTKNKANQSKESKEAMMFLKQKMDAAQGFIDAVKQRQNTLMTTMQAIIDLQRPFFLDGDESLLRPMILKDVAERTGLDISTISRVSNSKYVQTNYGIYPLKFFFNDGYVTEDGEEMSVREIRKILKECIDNEDRKKPYTDDELTEILKEKGYPIARRTVAKYRQQLNIPVARLRK